MSSFKGIALIITIAAAGFLFTGCKKAGEDTKAASTSVFGAPSTGHSQAIPFSIRSFDGREVSLQELKGKPVVVNFFASWCGPCQLEAPALREAWGEFGDRVEFVGVAIDDSEEGARAFIKEFNLKFPAGLDSTGEITKAYNIYGIPKTYVIDRTGLVLYEHSGVITREDLDKAIKLTL
jgi:cytochrome c biogenesis protein CcmG/thiol:disulfide interchange protein DsbE